MNDPTTRVRGRMLSPVALWLGILASPPEAPRFDPAALDADPGSRMELEPLPDGSYLYRDTSTGVRAVIDADGTVHFKETLVRPMLKLGDKDLLDRSAPRERDLHAPVPGMPALEGSADPTHDPNSYGPAPILIRFGVRLPSLADIVAGGKRYAARARFLSDSQPLREQLQQQARERRLRERLGSLEAELARVWNDPRLDRAERRRRVFELWDDCTESAAALDPGPEDAQRQKAGELGRRQIEAFVRLHGPEGGAFAFTRAELEMLNARRRSKQKFEPYRAGIHERAPPVQPLRLHAR